MDCKLLSEKLQDSGSKPVANQKDGEPFPAFGILPVILQSWELSQALSQAQGLYQLNTLEKIWTTGG